MTALLLAAGLVGAASIAYTRRWRAASDAGAWHLASFLTGMLTFMAAQGPLFVLAEERSSVAHVAVLILTIHVAPFFVVRAVTPDILGNAAEGFAGAMRRVPVAVPLVCLAVVAYGWHLPPLFEAAARDVFLGTLQHVSFVLVGLLAWLPICGHPDLRPTLQGLTAFLYMTGDELILGALGIVLTWAPNPLYEIYLDAPRLWDLSAHTDQMLSGAILTAVEEAPMAVALGIVFIRMLDHDEAAARERERSGASTTPDSYG